MRLSYRYRWGRWIKWSRILIRQFGRQACTAKFTEAGMTPTRVHAAWGDLSLYTDAESCPMCAAVIRWAGFKEYVYGTTIEHNYNADWGVLTLSSYAILQQSRALPGTQTMKLAGILKNETDPLFGWQYQPDARVRIGV